MQPLTIALSLLVLAVALEEARGLPRPAHKRVRRQTTSREVPDGFRVCRLVGGTAPAGCGPANCCPNSAPCVNYLPANGDTMSDNVVSRLGFAVQVCAETCTLGITTCPTGTACGTRGSETTTRCWPMASICAGDTETSSPSGPAAGSSSSNSDSSNSSSMEMDESCISDTCEDTLETELETACTAAATP